MKYFAGKVWDIVSFEIRNATSIEEFSAKIKCFRPENCPRVVHQVGYI